MNLDSLKMGFLEFIKEKFGAENTELNTSQDINKSIFQHPDEFKEYIEQELKGVNGGSDIVMSLINDAMQDENAINELDSDADGEITKEELSAFTNKFEDSEVISQDKLKELTEKYTNKQDGNKNENENSIDELLKTAYENKMVIAQLDKDGDGKLSDEEKAAFEETLKNENGEITEEAIKEAISKIIDGTYGKDEEAAEEQTPTETPEVSETPDAADTPQDAAAAQGAGNTGSAGGSSGTGGSSGGGGGGDNYSGGNDNSTPTSSGGLDNLSLSE
ncbi:hypothetical protein IJ182_03875, partial [bacterium]|nr:hypothetical protein [bacterium]